jgi:ribonucleoside-triphosphate reductase
MIVTERFELSTVTKNRLRSQQPNFGFGGLGAAVYYRSYSRKMKNGEQETWADTVIRVVEGIVSIRKWWYSLNRLHWDEDKWTKIANRMAWAMFQMRMLPAGRGLFAMGSDYVYERGSAACYNCAAVSVTNSLSKAANWAADLLLNGVGVGYDTHRSSFKMKYPDSTNQTFQVPDSREGWAEAFEVLIRSYEKGSASIEFDYSLVRPEGAPINGLGGTASGPAPLKDSLEQIRRQLNLFMEGKIGRSELITDTMNLIGRAVVSAGVRRSALISLGSPTDSEFINLKNYKLKPEREAWGFMSNNSIMLEDVEDFQRLPDIADNIVTNGEPGIINMLNMQKYGRYGDRIRDNATLINPCSEIPLENYEVCNLTEVMAPLCMNDEELYDAMELATIYASTLALLPTHRWETNEVVTRNRRIGVSISGISQWVSTQHLSHVITRMRQGYDFVEHTNKWLAREAGVPASVRLTTVKPSGSISLLAGVTPGVNYNPFPTYIRRVSVTKHSPVVPILVDAGMPYEQSVYDDLTWSFMLPTKTGFRGQGDVPLWEQGLLATTVGKHWADNAVSNTMTFRAHEADSVANFLAYMAPFNKSISMLGPQKEYKQMPYEAITDEKYEELSKNIREPDWSKLGGHDGQDERFCTDDSCLF